MSPPSPLIDGYGSPSFPVRSQSNDTSSNDEGKGKGKAKEEGPLGEDGVYDGGKGSGMKIQGQIGIASPISKTSTPYSKVASSVSSGSPTPQRYVPPPLTTPIGNTSTMISDYGTGPLITIFNSKTNDTSIISHDNHDDADREQINDKEQQDGPSFTITPPTATKTSFPNLPFRRTSIPSSSILESHLSTSSSTAKNHTDPHLISAMFATKSQEEEFWNDERGVEGKVLVGFGYDDSVMSVGGSGRDGGDFDGMRDERYGMRQGTSVSGGRKSSGSSISTPTVSSYAAPTYHTSKRSFHIPRGSLVLQQQAQHQISDPTTTTSAHNTATSNAFFNNGMPIPTSTTSAPNEPRAYIIPAFRQTSLPTSLSGLQAGGFATGTRTSRSLSGGLSRYSGHGNNNRSIGLGNSALSGSGALDFGGSRSGATVTQRKTWISADGVDAERMAQRFGTSPSLIASDDSRNAIGAYAQDDRDPAGGRVNLRGDKREEDEPKREHEQDQDGSLPRSNEMTIRRQKTSSWSRDRSEEDEYSSSSSSSRKNGITLPHQRFTMTGRGGTPKMSPLMLPGAVAAAAATTARSTLGLETFQDQDTENENEQGMSSTSQESTPVKQRMKDQMHSPPGTPTPTRLRSTHHSKIKQQQSTLGIGSPRKVATHRHELDRRDLMDLKASADLMNPITGLLTPSNSKEKDIGELMRTARNRNTNSNQQQQQNQAKADDKDGTAFGYNHVHWPQRNLQGTAPSLDRKTQMQLNLAQLTALSSSSASNNIDTRPRAVSDTSLSVSSITSNFSEFMQKSRIVSDPFPVGDGSSANKKINRKVRRKRKQMDLPPAEELVLNWSMLKWKYGGKVANDTLTGLQDAMVESERTQPLDIRGPGIVSLPFDEIQPPPANTHQAPAQRSEDGVSETSSAYDDEHDDEHQDRGEELRSLAFTEMNSVANESRTSRLQSQHQHQQRRRIPMREFENIAALETSQQQNRRSPSSPVEMSRVGRGSQGGERGGRLMMRS